MFWPFLRAKSSKQFARGHRLRTLLDFNPAVGVISDGSDSGIGSSGSSRCMPGHPTHNPLQFTTTGATAVTNPPALKGRSLK